jgi:hypothetical protein
MVEEEESWLKLHQSFQQHQPKVLQVCAQVDRTLIADNCILMNMIRNELRYLPGKPGYFRYARMDIKPLMRKIMSYWMLEVCQELCCLLGVHCCQVPPGLLGESSFTGHPPKPSEEV